MLDKDRESKKVIFKNCAPFTYCIRKINNTQVDEAKDLDVVMPMYNVIEYGNNYAITPGSLWQYQKDSPNDDITDSESFKFNS